VRTDLGGTPFTHDRLQIARLGLSYDRADAYDGITTARGMLHQGLSGQAPARPNLGQRRPVCRLCAAQRPHFRSMA
jgi:hypothetical protein